MVTTENILWTAEQVCGECVEGVFILSANGIALCDHCEHEHPMNTWNLDAGERFEWLKVGPSRVHGQTRHDVPYITLHVTAYETTEED